MRKAAQFNSSNLMSKGMLIDPVTTTREQTAPEAFKRRKWAADDLPTFIASRNEVLRYLFDNHSVFSSHIFMRALGKDSGRMIESLGWFRFACMGQDTETRAYRCAIDPLGEPMPGATAGVMDDESFERVLKALTFDRLEVYATEKSGDPRLNLIHRSKFSDMSDPNIRPFVGTPFPKGSWGLTTPAIKVLDSRH